MSVLPFKPRRPAPDDEGPNARGPAFCMACDHSWEAVAPVGTPALECPACHAMRGKFKFDYEPNDPVWTCRCDNQLFNVTRDGIFCPRCGNYQTFPK